MSKTDDLINSIKKSEEVLLNATHSFKVASLEITLSFWSRLIENSKSIHLLLSNNFINEAMAIHRLSIEHFSVIVGLLEGKTSFDELRNKDLADLPKQALGVQRGDKKNSSLTPENRERLQDFLTRTNADPAQTSGVSTYNLLDSCGLESIYINYRIYSIRAAHATIISATNTGNSEEKSNLIIDAISILELTNKFAEKFKKTISK